MQDVIERNPRDIQNKIVYFTIIMGIIGGLSITSLFFVIMILFTSFNDGLSVFWDLIIWIVPLIIGFGIQVGLYTYMKMNLTYKRDLLATKASLTAAGGTSAVSMLACCAHHLTDILPFMGVSVLATFFIDYQKVFLAIGISSNLIGMCIMLKNIVEYKLYIENGLFKYFNVLNMKYLLRGTILGSIIFSLTILINTLI